MIKEKISKADSKEIDLEALMEDISRIKNAISAREEGIHAIEEEQLNRLINTGLELDLKIKSFHPPLEEIKSLLRSHAEQLNWKTKTTNMGSSVVVSPTSSRHISPLDLVKRLKELGKIKLFSSLFSVKLSDAFRYLGEETLKDIVHTEKGNSSVSFKRSK